MVLNEPLVELGSQLLSPSASWARVAYCPFRKRNQEYPKLNQVGLSILYVFWGLVLKNWGREIVDEVQSKGDNQLQNSGRSIYPDCSGTAASHMVRFNFPLNVMNSMPFLLART